MGHPRLGESFFVRQFLRRLSLLDQNKDVAVLLTRVGLGLPSRLKRVQNVSLNNGRFTW
jgi:hypothetical protein